MTLDLPEPRTAEEARLIEATAYAFAQTEATNDVQRAVLAAFHELMARRIARRFPADKKDSQPAA